MLKHYIHCHEPYYLHKGGSVGYLSTLYSSFENYGKFTTSENIQNCFLFPNIPRGNRLYNRALEETIYDVFNYISDFQNPEGMQVLINERKRWFREILPLSEYGKIDFKNIRSIHMHGAYNFLPVFNTLRREGIEDQVVKILTTHNPHKPELEDMELISRGRNWSSADIKSLKYFYQQRDYWAFKLSDALMFPSEYSLEGYYKSWPEFEQIIKGKKIYFCTTSGQQKAHTIDKDTMRQSLNIPNDATVLLYLGRFVNIRGYDILIETAKRLIKNNKNIYFLVVGESTKAPDFDTPQWIQIPFTTTPGNYINMADACLCPNRGSLFDLSMIEILASGTPLLGCKVGGYKWLTGKTQGVLLAEPENVDSFVNIISQFIEITSRQKEKMACDNIRLYEEQLHLKYFHERYADTLNQIYDDFNIYERKDSVNRISRMSTEFERGYKRNEEQLFLVMPPTTEAKVLSSKQKNNVGNTTQPDKERVLTDKQKKIRKLKNNPKLFFSDMAKKKIAIIRRFFIK